MPRVDCLLSFDCNRVLTVQILLIEILGSDCFGREDALFHIYKLTGGRHAALTSLPRASLFFFPSCSPMLFYTVPFVSNTYKL